jgi:hypothetical protein
MEGCVYHSAEDGGEIASAPGLETTKQPDEDDAVPLAEISGTTKLNERFFGEDHMNMREMLKRFQQVGSTKSQSSDLQSSGSTIFYVPVTPQLHGVHGHQNGYPMTDWTVADSMKAWYSTMLEHFSYCYGFWRGSLRYKIVIHCTDPASLASLQVRASFMPKHEQETSWFGGQFMVPGTGAINNKTLVRASATEDVWGTASSIASRVVTAQQAMSGMELEQVYQQGVLEVTVPFFTRQAYLGLMEGTYHNNQTFPSEMQYLANTVSGWLLISVENSVEKGAFHNWGFTLFIAAGDDFEMAVPLGGANQLYNYVG